MDRVMRSLYCNLSEHELAESVKTLALTLQGKRDLEEEKKQIAADYKARIDRENEEATRLMRVVTTGQEQRDVGCIWISVESEKVEVLVREDTMEVIQKRPLVEQRGLEMDDNKVVEMNEWLKKVEEQLHNLDAIPGADDPAIGETAPARPEADDENSDSCSSNEGEKPEDEEQEDEQ